jgi:hypothetical protein
MVVRPGPPAPPLRSLRRPGRASGLMGPYLPRAVIAIQSPCGFRAASIRPDYFWYLDTPEYENGLPVLDMIVFRMELG